MATLSWDIQGIREEIAASEKRTKEEMKRSEERIKQEISERHYKIREEAIKSSFRIARQVLYSAEDVKVHVAEDNNRVIEETHDTVAEARDNVVRRVDNATRSAVKEGVSGTYFAPEVRRAVGVAELKRIAGSRVAEEWRRTSPTESVFTETDRVLRDLEATLRKANSMMMAAENLLSIMQQRMKKIVKEARSALDEEKK